MSKSSKTEIEHPKEIGNVIQQFIYRLPKKNHEAMVQLEKQFSTYLEGYEVFQLSSTENMMDWTNIAETMSANQDEEVWVEQVYSDTTKYRIMSGQRSRGIKGRRQLSFLT